MPERATTYNPVDVKEDPIQSIKRLFYNVPWNVEIFDKHGNLLWVNKCAKENWKSDKLEPNKEYNIIHEIANNYPDFKDNLDKALLGNVTTIEGPDYHNLKHEDINPVTYEATFTPYYSPENEVSHVIIFNKIIKKTEPNNKYSQQESTNYRNPATAFFRNISHELRTPLNWIIGFSDLIKHERDPLKIKGYNEHINKGGKLMLASIEMLIDMSLIEKEEINLIFKEISTDELLNEAKLQLNDSIKSLGLNLSVRIKNFLSENDTNYRFTSDEDKMRKILNGLVHNSLKYTKEGFIEIGCTNSDVQDIVFYVRDSGIGMSKDIQQYLQEIFDSDARDISATVSEEGLSLAIVRNYIKLLGGKIWIDSETKKGTTFYFSIKNHS